MPGLQIKGNCRLSYHWVRGTGDHTVITLCAKLHRFEIGRLSPCVEPVITLFHQRYLQGKQSVITGSTHDLNGFSLNIVKSIFFGWPCGVITV